MFLKTVIVRSILPPLRHCEERSDEAIHWLHLCDKHPANGSPRQAKALLVMTDLFTRHCEPRSLSLVIASPARGAAIHFLPNTVLVSDILQMDHRVGLKPSS